MSESVCDMSTFSPRQAADALVASFDEVRQFARPMSRVCEAATRAIGKPLDAADEAVHRGCVSIARAIDDQPDFYDRHAYHNRQHFCEVVLTAQWLCRLNGISPRGARRVLLAAIVHDLEHDGAASSAFAFERRSVTRAAPFLSRAGVDEAEYCALKALVLSTDPRHGVPAATLIHRGHLSGQTTGSMKAPVAELQLLIDDRELARAAAVLCEADVLPSVGLSLAHALHLQDRLAREWGRRLRPEDKLRFIDEVVRAGVIGEFFLPNVLAIRRSLVASLPASLPTPLPTPLPTSSSTSLPTSPHASTC